MGEVDGSEGTLGEGEQEYGTDHYRRRRNEGERRERRERGRPRRKKLTIRSGWRSCESERQNVDETRCDRSEKRSEGWSPEGDLREEDASGN